jgi:hypothetical protein
MGLTREAKYSFGDDISLNLVTPPGNTLSGYSAHQFGPGERSPLTGIGNETRTKKIAGQVRHGSEPLRPSQLADGSLGSRGRASLDGVGRSTPRQGSHSSFCIDGRQSLPDERIGIPPHMPGKSYETVEQVTP